LERSIYYRIKPLVINVVRRSEEYYKNSKGVGEAGGRASKKRRVGIQCE